MSRVNHNSEGYGDWKRDHDKGERAVEAVEARQAACAHDLVELVSVNGVNLNGAKRVCVSCRKAVRS